MQSKAVCGFTLSYDENNLNEQMEFDRAKSLIEDMMLSVQKQVAGLKFEKEFIIRERIVDNAYLFIYGTADKLMLGIYDKNANIYTNAKPVVINSIPYKTFTKLITKSEKLEKLLEKNAIPDHYTLRNIIKEYIRNHPEHYVEIEHHAKTRDRIKTKDDYDFMR